MGKEDLHKTNRARDGFSGTHEVNFWELGGLLEKGALLSATLWQNGLRKEPPKPIGLTTGISLEGYIRWQGFYNIRLINLWRWAPNSGFPPFQKGSVLKILP